MKKQRTSILFIDTHSTSRTPLQVPSHLIKHWRKYVLYASIVFIVFGLVIGFLIYQQTSSYYSKKLTFVQQLKMKADVSKVQRSFSEIDQYLNKVNKLLKAKGLKEIPTQNMGGEALDITDVDNVTSYYVNQLEDLEKSICEIPIGAPHSGPITSRFGYRSNPFSGQGHELHGGIDFKGNTGEQVKSTAKGKVIHAGRKGGYGNCVIVAHSQNIKTLYGHLSGINVSVNDKIESGTVIGKLGSTGRSTGPHLHYEIHRQNKRIDPFEYLTF
ncbi:M23 family metallopeptidase [Niabella ginsengisoli]|uniref:M23 family metallopeptidase n=1 Tax=Niabella ginsengisoli TaxID=522298 RepID=A0ABS9SPD1_9BACT|nr:M23 family metallopeptidase [Niabella ginsengisoli]MCH5600200.1 M23 family metallopeptidase [Niabella ginsengisoli]